MSSVWSGGGGPRALLGCPWAAASLSCPLTVGPLISSNSSNWSARNKNGSRKSGPSCAGWWSGSGCSLGVLCEATSALMIILLIIISSGHICGAPYLFIYLWLRWFSIAVFKAFCGCSELGPLVAVHRLLIAVASLAVEHRPWGAQALGSTGPREHRL